MNAMNKESFPLRSVQLEFVDPPPSILLVDDDRNSLTALTEVLNGLDAHVVCASSGREALRAILQYDFAIILLDVRMPDMDGYETATLIRDREKSRHTPLIFLTAAQKESADVFRGYSYGAVDYVFKPIEPVVLRAKVAVFLEMRRQAYKIVAQAEYEKRLLEENFEIQAAKIEAEHQLHSIKERQALIIRSLPIAFYEGEILAETTRRKFVHDNVLRLIIDERTDFETHTADWASRVHPDDWPLIAKAIEATSTANEYAVKYRWKCADGSYRYFLDQGVVASRENRKPLKIVGTMLDVHERRALEEQLIHAQKLDAIGKLTGGIVHDFGNMLWIIISNLEHLQANIRDEPSLKKSADLALKSALHCKDVTKRLLGFARQQPLRSGPLNLSALIVELSDMFGRTIGGEIDVKKELADDLWAVFVDRAQMEAAVLNLVMNARDAMSRGGRLTIKTTNVELGGGAHGCPDLPVGAYVLLEVEDTGEGMTEDVLKRALEPFFTTKEPGEGTGLGLSTTYGFVRQSGGDLLIASTPKQGSKIQIYLPRYSADRRGTSRGSLKAKPRVSPRASNNEAILAVEDNPDARQSTVDLLRGLGYRVFEAGTGAAALDTLEMCGDVDLLLTDIIMPGNINGFELAREAQRRRPNLKVLYISAYAESRTFNSGVDKTHPLLRKPFQNHELAQAVRDALRRPASVAARP